MYKTLLMFSTAAAALLGAQAQAASFGYTGAEQTYDITTTGMYDFTAAGASGGSALLDGFVYSVGGTGARVEGMTTLTAGSVLDIFVGGAGRNGMEFGGGGGGGGTFVFLQPSGSGSLTADTALIVGGGGGGGSGFSAYTNGGNAVGTGGSGQGGVGGVGGSFFGSAGGAGVGGNGASETYNGMTQAQGGFSPSNGGSGGRHAVGTGLEGGDGGFGGGGGADGGGGGGGGFTGGDGAYDATNGGGAGTSYLRDGATLLSQGLNTSADGNGGFNIALAPVVSPAPEPATWLTMMLGLGGAGAALRRRKIMSAPRTV